MNLLKRKKESPEKQKESPAFPLSPDFLNYKKIEKFDSETGYLVCEDNSLGAMYQIRGKGIQSASLGEKQLLSRSFGDFLKVYYPDLKFIVSQYPLETMNQIHYWEQKLKLAPTENHKRKIAFKIDQLQTASRKETNQEYMLMIFGNDKKEIERHEKLLFSNKGRALDLIKISPDKLENKLFNLNNMNTPL